MNKSIRLAGMLLLAAACLTPANAAQPAPSADGEPTARVRYGDLNLASASGIAALDSRIRHAAERLCETPGVRPLAERLDRRRCVRGAVAGARGQFEQALAAHGRARDAGRRMIAVRLPN